MLSPLLYWLSLRIAYAAFGEVVYVAPSCTAPPGLRYVYAREAYTRYGGGFYDLGNIALIFRSPATIRSRRNSP